MPKQTKSTGKSSARATEVKNALALMLTVANALVSPGVQRCGLRSSPHVGPLIGG